MKGITYNTWAGAGSTIASLMFIWTIVDKFIPSTLKTTLFHYTSKLTTRLLNPYIHITIPEFTSNFSMRNDAYTAVEAYLIATSSHQAKKLKAEITNLNQNLTFTIDTNEEVTDIFQGARFWWLSGKTEKKNTFSWNPDRDEKRFYRLTFHLSNQNLVTSTYLPYVINEGKVIGTASRRRRLYTNNASDSSSSRWSSVQFNHPATFDTLAMDPTKKKEIMDDLIAHRKRKGYYTKVGKAWKRGYLLYGPPGTGKSSMIAAMANFLNYDVYDLELTAVKNNSKLRKLLLDTASKAIIVIEDIDCSLEIAGKRVDDNSEEESNKKEGEKNQGSKMTLSGLLNFIDGLWSACDGERIIMFTTNHVEKLDPALIRRGRMDMHIELSYCRLEGFKVLAKNYLGIESHYQFDRIGELMEEVNSPPADVAENLMPKSVDVDVDVEACIKNLVDVLCKLKEDAKDEEILSDETLIGDNNGSEESV